MNFHDFADIAAREVIPGHFGKFIHSQHMTLACWEIQKGARLPLHAHLHEQVTHLLEGEYELTIDGETRRLKKGAVATIPPHVLHEGVALTACRIMDVFFPVREDYR